MDYEQAKEDGIAGSSHDDCDRASRTHSISFKSIEDILIKITV